jgi:hypothetical protein
MTIDEEAEAMVEEVFGTHHLLASQLDRSATADFEPDRTMLAKALEDAVKNARGTLTAPDAHGRPRFAAKIAAEAREWILTENHAPWVGFDWTCEALGIEPGYIRRKVREAA